jgi:uncharacterized protein
MSKTLSAAMTLAVMALVLAGGCAAKPPQWPAISETATNVHTQGRWIWGELFADDVDAEKAFYREVFGWQYESYGSGKDAYTLIRAGGRPIAGLIHYAKPADARRSARWIAFMSVPDVARAAEQAAAGGGKVLVPPRALPGRGEAAILADPEGALFGVLYAAGGDPADAIPSDNAWLWLELWARDAGAMAGFYRSLGAYTISRQEGPGDRPELYLVAEGYPRAGVLEIERTGVPSTWLPYVRVKDLQETVAAVERAGGRIIVPPSPAIRGGKVAVFLDPLGAAVAAAEWKDASDGEGKP